MTPHERYEDRMPADGFELPSVGDSFILRTPRFMSSDVSYTLPAGTNGKVIGIREPGVPCGGFVGCVVRFDHPSFLRKYPCGYVVPWDEITDTTRFVFE